MAIPTRTTPPDPATGRAAAGGARTPVGHPPAADTPGNRPNSDRAGSCHAGDRAGGGHAGARAIATSR